MAHQRMVVGHRLRRSHRLKCFRCSNVLYRFEQFCPACGSLNDRFDAEIFRYYAFMPFEQARAACSQWDHFVERFEAVEPTHQSAYCTLCGQYFDL